MKLSKSITNIALTCTALLAFGCGGSDDDGLGNCSESAWTQIVANEAALYSDPLFAYQNDPSAANCDNVKSAAVNYLEALRDILDCVPTTNRAEINDAIDDAQEEVNSEDCN